MTDRFRVDEAYGNVYVWDDNAAYVFYMKLDLFIELAAAGESEQGRQRRLENG